MVQDADASKSVLTPPSRATVGPRTHPQHLLDHPATLGLRRWPRPAPAPPHPSAGPPTSCTEAHPHAQSKRPCPRVSPPGCRTRPGPTRTGAHAPTHAGPRPPAPTAPARCPLPPRNTTAPVRPADGLLPEPLPDQVRRTHLHLDLDVTGQGQHGTHRTLWRTVDQDPSTAMRPPPDRASRAWPRDAHPPTAPHRPSTHRPAPGSGRRGGNGPCPSRDRAPPTGGARCLQGPALPGRCAAQHPATSGNGAEPAGPRRGRALVHGLLDRARVRAVSPRTCHVPQTRATGPLQPLYSKLTASRAGPAPPPRTRAGPPRPRWWSHYPPATCWWDRATPSAKPGFEP